jgi:Ca-activated chloride channel family protein
MKAMAGVIVERRAPTPAAQRSSTGSVVHHSIQLFSLLICIAMLTSYGHAQALLSTSTPFPSAPLPTFSKDVQEVSLVLTVTNKRGRFVRDLDLKDIAILDNDLPPEKVTFFQSETDLPLRVALVVDTSDSITHRFAFEKDAASAFLKKVLRPTSDLGMIVGFNQHVHVAQGASNDPRKLREGLDRLSLGGETAVYEAVKAASQQLAKVRDTQSSRRAIVLITDGEDNRSNIGLQDAINAALHADAVVYVLSTNPELSISLAQEGDKAMRQLAENTGGRLLRAGEDDDVKSAFSKLAQELRSQYAISYKPAIKSPDGLFHHLIVTGPKKLRFYHRLGYFAR